MADKHTASYMSLGWSVRKRVGRRRTLGYEVSCSCGWHARVSEGGKTAAERAFREHKREAVEKS